jgi:L-histidine Nalpha-methyltransferase
VKTTGSRVCIEALAGYEDPHRRMAADVREGLSSTPKRLPPKYFYDARGSELFERITRLPEYYLSRAETEILEAFGESFVAALQPDEILEIGSGSSRKTRLLIEAMHRRSGGRRYVALDVSEAALGAAGAALTEDYPWLDFQGFLGDFERDLASLPRGPRRAVVFLGSTVGNLAPAARVAFLQRAADLLGPGGRLLLGVDLVKDTAVLEAAYNDAAGVTAEFNRNVLRVLNRGLGADFPVEDFAHVAFYDVRQEWIEMRLRAARAMRVHVRALDLEVQLAEGEEVQTEISCKLTRASVDAMFAAAGLQLVGWETDAGSRFALAVGVRRPQQRGRG